MGLKKAVLYGLGRVVETALKAAGEELGRRAVLRVTRRWTDSNQDESRKEEEE